MTPPSNTEIPRSARDDIATFLVLTFGLSAIFWWLIISAGSLDAQGGRYVLAQVKPGQVFALANEHLPSDPYGPYLVRDGKSLRQVLRNERSTRMPAARAALRGVRPALDAGIPTLLTGDFNAPSYLDWTPATVGTRNGLRYPVAWPVSRAFAAAGFQDSYRVVHPDPVANPACPNSRGSRRGAVARSSMSTNATRISTPPMRPTSVMGSVQPRSGPSMIPRTSNPVPSADAIEPKGSKATRSVDLVEGTTRTMAISASAASAAVATKIAPQ